MKFDRSNKFDLNYYGQLNSLWLKLSIYLYIYIYISLRNEQEENLWGSIYFAGEGTLKSTRDDLQSKIKGRELKILLWKYLYHVSAQKFSHLWTLVCTAGSWWPALLRQGSLADSAKNVTLLFCCFSKKCEWLFPVSALGKKFGR